MPTTSHSAIGRCSALSASVWLPRMNGKAFTATAAAMNGTASHGRWRGSIWRFQTKYPVRKGRTKKLPLRA